MPRFVQSKDVAWNYLGERVIAFNLNGEKQFHDLNETAAVIFSALQIPMNEKELVEAVLKEFEVDPAQAADDVQAILAEMNQKRLIIEA